MHFLIIISLTVSTAIHYLGAAVQPFRKATDTYLELKSQAVLSVYGAIPA